MYFNENRVAGYLHGFVFIFRGPFYLHTLTAFTAWILFCMEQTWGSRVYANDQRIDSWVRAWLPIHTIWISETPYGTHSGGQCVNHDGHAAMIHVTDGLSSVEWLYTLTTTTSRPERLGTPLSCLHLLHPLWDVITYPCLYSNSGLTKPPLQWWYGWIIRSPFLCECD